MPVRAGEGGPGGGSRAGDGLIVGQVNAGKTLLLINFAAHLGVRELALDVTWPSGVREKYRYSVEQAREILVDGTAHTTRGLQAVELQLPRGKGRKTFRLTDTGGLIDTVHEFPDVRLAIAQTLRALRRAALVLHVMDAAAIGNRGVQGTVGEVDRQVAAFAPLQCPYAILANKMDLPWAQTGLMKIAREFAPRRVIPVSALTGRGFREVKSFVWDHL